MKRSFIPLQEFKVLSPIEGEQVMEETKQKLFRSLIDSEEAIQCHG
jgi:hypothetical protein